MFPDMGPDIFGLCKPSDLNILSYLCIQVCSLVEFQCILADMSKRDYHLHLGIGNMDHTVKADKDWSGQYQLVLKKI